MAANIGKKMLNLKSKAYEKEDKRHNIYTLMDNCYNTDSYVITDRKSLLG